MPFLGSIVESVNSMHKQWEIITDGEKVVIDAEGNNAFLLNETGSVYLVYEGKLDIFAVTILNGVQQGSREHLFQMDEGSFAFTVSEESMNLEGIALLACGAIGTRLLRIKRSKLEELSATLEHTDTVALILEKWVIALSDSMGEAGGIIASSWLLPDPGWSDLEKFHRNTLNAIRFHRDEINRKEYERIKRQGVADQLQIDSSLRKLSGILMPDEETVYSKSDDPLIDVCNRVAHPLGITIIAPPQQATPRKMKDPLAEIARASRIRVRKVALKGDWWQQDNGSMVAFIEESGEPVALIQKSSGSYQMYNPSGGGSLIPVTKRVAGNIDPFAYVMYRSLPSTLIKGKDLLLFAARGRWGDIFVVILTGLAGGILGLLTPIITGIIFDTIIPEAEISKLLMLALALLIGAVSTAIFGFTRSIAMLRIEGRMDQHVQAAVWDRLLELPVPFFREYTSGDLADRAMGINLIRQTLSGSAINAMLSGIFSIFNLMLLFWYSTKLAFVALGLTFFAILFVVLASFYQLRYLRLLAGVSGKLTGLLLECVTGIAKFRVSGSEGRVFAQWAAKFAEQKELSRKSATVKNIVETFSSVYPVISSVIIFMMIVSYSKQSPMSTGSFLAFNSSFGQFLQAVLGVAMSVISSASIMPLYQRCKPILETLPETDETKSYPGELTGEIEVSGLTFRYIPDGPLILDDVSLRAKPGEFIALVGASGCGKSTLLRLLLGFEKAGSGGIFYDGQDVSTLDIRSVRQQMGVVLQNGQVMSGDIFTNIVGSSLLTIDDAWEAARMAGLEPDIRSMPMEMHTVISQGGGTLSGGQRQRLLIARALVARPRILFFDEATSALDNMTQSIVIASLEQLNNTRIVIAHRLSTIIRADRIYVLDQGRVVQCGTYNELIAQDGFFAEHAKRQIV